LAHSFLADGQIAPAVLHLRQALQFSPKNADIRIELAQALARDSQPQEALKILQEGVNGDPRDVTLRAGMAGLLSRLSHPIQGLEEINQALRIEPNRPELYVVRAALLANEPGFIELGIAGYETALKLNPSLEIARKSLEIARATKEKALDDAKPFREQIRTNPQNAEAHYNLGAMEMRAGELESARQEFARASSLDPGEGQSHINMALIDFIRKDYRSAAGELQKARECGVSPPADLVDGVERKVVP
jgi:Flp pilus assembly protein TadD